MGTHLAGPRKVGGRLLLVVMAVLAALTAIAASVVPATALGSPILLSITVSPTTASVPIGETEQFTATGHYSDLSTQNITNTATWSTSSSSVATVSNTTGSQGLATAIRTGVATITAAEGTAVSGTAAMTVLPAVLLTITVSPAAASIPLGESAAFLATGHYSDLSTQNLTSNVTWSSSSTTVATVSNASGSQGQATAVGTGVATITATVGSVFGTAVATVIPAVLVAVTVSPTAASVPKGETQQFTATGNYSNATTQNLTNTVTWSSSSNSVASVSNSSGSQGLVTATGAGATTITATDPSSLLNGTAAVTVLPAVLVAVTVSPTAASVPKGETQQFTATGHYSDATTQNLTGTVTWSSSSTTVATVSNASGSQGLVTATGTGGATITATDPSSLLNGTAAVTVLPAVLVAVTVSPTAASVPKGETQQFTATGHYSDLSTLNLTNSVTWSSSSTTVATVSNTSGSHGLVTATGTGATTITATDPSSLLNGTAAVTVLPAVLVAVTVSPTAASVPKGETQQFTATGHYSDLSTLNLTNSVTWSSSSTSVATVSSASGSQGLVTATGTGAATITATDPSSLLSGTALVTVLPAVLVAVTVSPPATSIPNGDTLPFAATGHYSDGATSDLTSAVTWSSSSTSIATVSNASGSQGHVTATGTGAATITATDPSSLLSGTALVTVLPAVLVAVTVSPAAASVPNGENHQFTATGHYSDGTTSDLTSTVTWSSSSTSVATVSNASGSQGLVTATGTGAATITATDPSSLSSGTALVTVLPAVLIAVTVSPVAASVPSGESEQLTATGRYSDGTTKDLTDTVTWSSSDTTAATVSNASGSQGLVTGVGTGAATITATDPSSLLNGTAIVTVLPAVLVAITVSPLAASVPVGESAPFLATGHYSDATTKDLTDVVTWSTSDPTIATVSNTSGSQGEVTGTGTGGATITATDPSSLVNGTAVVTVLPAVLLAITVSPTAASVPDGETQQFTATGHYSDLSTQNLTGVVTWSSSDTSVATVSNSAGSQGLVTGTGTGAATITATDPSSVLNGTAVVTVLPAVLVAVTVSPLTASVANGKTTQLTATGHYSDLSSKNLTDVVTWSSSDTSVATVSNNSGSQGLVTGTGTGAATITATDPSSVLNGTAVVTVLPAVLVAVTVSPLAASVPNGETQQFTATGHYSDGTTQDLTDVVTWSSSDTSVATVSNSSGSKGLVTGTGTGAATITATDPSSLLNGTAVVTVLPAVLVAVTVSPTAASVPNGETQPFSATGHYSDGTTKDLTDVVTWSSSDTSVASVSNSVGSQGEVTGVGTGVATITATDTSSVLNGTAVVTVLPAVLLAITVSPTQASVALHGSKQFTATGHYSDLSTRNITDSVTWSTSNTGDATISNAAGSQGVATGVATGDVVVTATDTSSGVLGVADLTVTGIKLVISPSTGPPRTKVTVLGEGFTPGTSVKIIYKTGVPTKPRFKICTATVGSDGTFSCIGHIRGLRVAGAPGAHTVVAKVPHSHTVAASTTYTLTS